MESKTPGGHVCIVADAPHWLRHLVMSATRPFRLAGRKRRGSDTILPLPDRIMKLVVPNSTYTAFRGLCLFGNSPCVGVLRTLRANNASTRAPRDIKAGQRQTSEPHGVVDPQGRRRATAPAGVAQKDPSTSSTADPSLRRGRPPAVTKAQAGRTCFARPIDTFIE